jgi:cytochrome c
MRSPLAVVLCLTVSALLPAAAARADGIADAKTLLLKASAHLREVGEQQAFADFQDKSKPFIDGDLYVLVYSMEGVCLSHGQDPKLVGKSRLDVTDANGRKYIADIVADAKIKHSGFIDYVFKSPKSGKVEPKVTFWSRPEGKDYFLGVGVYRK